MIYALSKIGGIILQPSMLLLAFLILGMLFLFLHRSPRLGMTLVGLSVTAIAACAILPVGAWLLQPLEDRFPRPALPRRVDGIIVLGGAIDLKESAARDIVSLNGHAERMTMFVALARQYPQAELVFTGGNPDLFGRGPTEAYFARELFASLGIDPERIVFENASRNTRENALFSWRKIQPKPGAKWLLVASAPDMPRAVGCFQAVGWPVIPVPVDYSTRPGAADWFPGLTDSLLSIDWAAHEWIGLAYYRLRGWTPSLFPSADFK